MRSYRRTKSDRNSVETGKTLPRRVTSYAPTRPQPDGRGPATEDAASSRRPWPRIAALFLLIILSAFILVAVWDARNISKASQKLFGEGSLLTLVRGGSLKSSSDGRINILIAGYSADDPGHSGAQLTDSIILLSLDPSGHTGYLLSIPRDLYVNIPGFGYAKINEAYVDGGLALLEKVISRDFGVEISYNALINYAAVRGIVDALGGITVNINSPDGRLYDPNRDWTTGGPLVDLSNGSHHLSGEQALDLTRARGDPSVYGQAIGFEQSDFQRTADQRLVFAAIKEKLNWKLILDPRQNGRILNAVADNVQTDVPAGAARPLFGLFNSIPDSQLKSLSLRDLNGTNYLNGYTTYYGQSALVPAAGIDDYSQIRSALQAISR